MKLVRVGQILGPHGLGGHVRVIPVDYSTEVVEQDAVWSVGFDPDSVMARRVEECRRHITARGTSLIVRFDGVSDRSAAGLLKGAGVYVREAELEGLALPEGDGADWSGFRVIDGSGLSLGEVAGRLTMPAHDLLVVNRPDGRDALVPLVPEIVEEVDVDRRVVIVNPPEGLLD